MKKRNKVRLRIALWIIVVLICIAIKQAEWYKAPQENMHYLINNTPVEKLITQWEITDFEVRGLWHYEEPYLVLEQRLCNWNNKCHTALIYLDIYHTNSPCYWREHFHNRVIQPFKYPEILKYNPMCNGKY